MLKMKDIDIRYSNQTDIPQIKNLMNSVFGDEESFLIRFFNLFYQDNVLIAEANNCIVSMAFLLPNNIMIQGQLLPITYLYACATHAEYRGKGLMSRIIAKAYEDVCKRGEVGLLLLPANESLYHYYEDLGFKNSFFFDEILFSQEDNIAPTINSSFKIEKITAETYYQLRNITLTTELSILNPLQYFLLMEANPEEKEQGFYLIYFRNEPIAICYLSKSNTNLRIKELLPSDIDLPQLFLFLSRYFDVKQIVINIPGTTRKSAQIKLNSAYSYLEMEKGYFNFGLE